MIPEDNRATLIAAWDRLGPGAQTWLAGMAKTNGIPNVRGATHLLTHRDRLSWLILVAQLMHEQQPEAEPNADEPVPAHVHDDDTSPEAYERPPKYDPDDAVGRPGRPMP
jgi:hypothetical protein